MSEASNPRRVGSAAEKAMASTDREIGELRADMRHVLQELAEARAAHRAAAEGLNARLDRNDANNQARFAQIEAKVAELVNNRSLALGALAVAAAVGGFVMWVFKAVAAPFLERGL